MDEKFRDFPLENVVKYIKVWEHWEIPKEKERNDKSQIVISYITL